MNEVLMQLFIEGPTWDGNLISKSDRDELVENGYAERLDGWNFLTSAGVCEAVREGRHTHHWYDTRWYRKASLLP